ARKGEISLNIKARIGTAVAVIVFMASADMPAQSPSDFKRQRAKRVSPQPSVKKLTSIAEQFGGPLPGLTAEQLAEFEEGLEEFQKEDTAESGLGPTFNDVSCAAC